MKQPMLKRPMSQRCKRVLATRLSLASAALWWTVGVHAAAVHLGDVVPVPAAINDFELAPGGWVGNTWSQQGVRVTQINGDPGSIWTQSGLGNGARSWYPDAGDDGWTRITLDSGLNFDALSFFGDSGWITQPQSIYYELADDGVVVLSGTLAATFAGQGRSFSGGDFDEVRLRAGRNANSLQNCAAVPDYRCNYFWIDDIRVGAAELPLPSTAWLVVPALALMAGLGKASRQQAPHAH